MMNPMGIVIAIVNVPSILVERIYHRSPVPPGATINSTATTVAVPVIMPSHRAQSPAKTGRHATSTPRE
jgi:hypothetical protein